jgi:endonuclease-3
MEGLVAEGLSVEWTRKVSEARLTELIGRVNFKNTKSKNIKRTADLIWEKHGGNTPTDYKEVIAMPGVGPKMTLLYIQITTGRIDGIAVDTHVHRLANRLGWVEGKTPNDTRRELEALAPKEMWGRINKNLVGFG